MLYDKSRLTLTINVFNRPTQVELEFRQVEKQFNLFGLKTPDLRANQALLLTTVSLLEIIGEPSGVCTEVI